MPVSALTTTTFVSSEQVKETAVCLTTCVLEVSCRVAGCIVGMPRWQYPTKNDKDL